MEYGYGNVGEIVKHKLMGKVIIVDIPDFNAKFEHKWTIRVKDGNTLLVRREELEIIKEKK